VTTASYDSPIVDERRGLCGVLRVVSSSAFVRSKHQERGSSLGKQGIRPIISIVRQLVWEKPVHPSKARASRLHTRSHQALTFGTPKWINDDVTGRPC